MNEVEPLKNVQISVPSGSHINQDVPLTCLYDLDHGESLYTVKWYLESEEFYRYIPKRFHPSKPLQPWGLMLIVEQVCNKLKLNIEIGRTQGDAPIRPHEQTGVYKCEVSADAPEFETDVVSAQMTVVAPKVNGVHAGFQQLSSYFTTKYK
ncbi:hypothetical protein Ocin01_13040 [Orchesella cincta]|uniref:Ig-like domain-containing protein n=1 Tax=Orchesella cincta TaxID=48709 RepID=A0A1D2ML78_ORCCI|nr:hypothetical protein Ocin01_13040 [Orchesella cincta]